ncbi:MAG: hypothetical protein GF308_06120 [Candidatus Heimdallarchaeota archaeon]|nr:hypothetical protein [Candidatus Heimdallarchaeota archaeon]
MTLLNEDIVMDFYCDLLSQDEILFLKGKKDEREKIMDKINELKEIDKLHDKIELAKDLWKVLFKNAMSFIDPNLKGYDTLFRYFDVFVDFEELIFASDSFYRDHTLHCLWVYFLGEYLFRNPEYQPLFSSFNEANHQANKIVNFYKKFEMPEIFEGIISVADNFQLLEENEESIRCVVALAHDLGYPLKKIAKINKSIGEILPFFSIFKFGEFDFQFDTIQQFYINSFLELMSARFDLTPTEIDLNFTEFDLVQGFFTRLNKIGPQDYEYNINANTEKFNELKQYLKSLGEQEKFILKRVHEVKGMLRKEITRMLRYSNDFETYQHGIMSSFLLIKTLNAFSNMKISYSDPDNIPSYNFSLLPIIDAKLNILQAMADHTSPGFQIRNFNSYSSFLILIDEIEEFSRISRADQFREFVNEFCKSSVTFQDGILKIDFIFDNADIPNLNPEIAFKGKCTRFLNVFDLSNLDEKIRIRFRCIGKIPENKNIYELTIENGSYEITVNNEKQDINDYLRTEEIS